MQLPFTPDQFFALFARYNDAFLPVVVVLWVVTAGFLAACWRKPSLHSARLAYLLAATWAWSAAVYHAWLFTRINPAAWLFAVLFAVEAILLARAGGTHLQFFARTDWVARLGILLIAYALLYPFLTLALGHQYPATPTFGVPCPTAILTIGALLTVKDGPPVVLALVPTLWGFVGGSAALLLGVPTDYALLAAGVLMVVVGILLRR